MSHVSDLDIELYLDEGLSFFKRRVFERHLASCPECAARLSSARGEREYVRGMVERSRELNRIQGTISKSVLISSRLEDTYEKIARLDGSDSEGSGQGL